jgi:hypothetical protein
MSESLDDRGPSLSAMTTATHRQRKMSARGKSDAVVMYPMTGRRPAPRLLTI